MIRILLLCAIIALISSSSYSQSPEKVIIRDAVPDTVYKTKIEHLLRAPGIVKKVEYSEATDISFPYFRIVTITNLSTGAKEKGVYISTLNYINLALDFTSDERHAYLDTGEVDSLISFLDSCNTHWKNQTPSLRTLYEYETADNLRISFSATTNSNAWLYYIRFAGYHFNNLITLKKSQSDVLLAALKQMKKELHDE